MEENTVALQVELSEELAWAFAQFVKRAGYADYRALAENEAQAYAMLHAGERLRQALIECGIAPR